MNMKVHANATASSNRLDNALPPVRKTAVMNPNCEPVISSIARPVTPRAKLTSTNTANATCDIKPTVSVIR